MKALVWEAPRELALRDQPTPEVAAGEALIRVAYAGICGSELSAYLGHNALRVPPLVMGHEFAGTVAALGPTAQERNPALAAGLAVTVNPLTFCGQCDFCTHGQHQLCANRQLIGAHRAGGYAEYVAVPAETIVPLPAGMAPHLGALVEPLAVSVRVVEHALGEGAVPTPLLVIGAGPIGLLVLQVLHLRGAAQVFVADLDAARLAMAAGLGAEPLDPRERDVVKTVREASGGLGAPVTIDAVGTAATRAQCVAATRSGGTLVLCGLHEETSAMPAADMIRREIVARGTFAYTPANFATALDLLAKGTVRLDPWIVEAPLAEGGLWFERLLEEPGNVSKVLLIP
jgi:threonine dehydrogenase-like Zn-dependent dehydrogenase